MILTYMLAALVGSAAGLLLIALVRALLLKPNSAVTAKSPASDPVRAKEYGGKLSRMVQIETISTRGETDFAKFRAFQEALRPMFPHIFETCEIAHPGEGLLIRYPAKGQAKKQPLLLMSHHDVVPPQAEGWVHPPFSGHIDEQGVLWGRGTVDTKGSLFCELQALEELIAAGWQPDYDLYIASSCTEEWGGPGAPATVEYLKARGVTKLGMLVDEGGMVLEAPIAGMHGKYCMVGALEKGTGNVQFIARGRGGHASAPTPNSPLVRLGKFMADIEKHSPFKAELTPVLREMFGRLAPNADFGFKYILSNLWLFGPIVKKFIPKLVPLAGSMLCTTCAFTQAAGSDAANVLPVEASVTANLRFAAHQDDEASLAALRKRAAKYDIEVIPGKISKPCPPVDFTAAPFKLLEQIADRIYPGMPMVPYAMTGNTDARFFTGICDHCLRFAPLEITRQQYDSVHSINECLDLSALPPAVDFYKELAKAY